MTTKKVHRNCGKHNVVLSNKFKKINPEYVGMCNTCGFPVTQNEIISLADYKKLKMEETHINVDGEWVEF